MLYDILFTLDPSDCFCGVAWGSRETEDLYRDLFESWAAARRPVRTAFALPREGESGALVWEENTFHFQLLPAPEGGRWLLLKREDNRPYLLARALDQVTDGVQIYDKNACAVYFNRASRSISHIPSWVSVEGRHLLDLYNLDETISTTMTALQTKAPVIDRVDSFRTTDFSAVPIASANTSYPIFREGELLGAVVFEQTAEIVDRNIKKLEAAGGTLFLDELNSMSLAMQSKILRVLQEKTFRRVGGSQDLRLDVRVISSCNEDPFKAVAENTFRQDLFYRLSTVMIELPPLREHLEDLEELIRYHLEATAYQFVHAVTRIDPEVIAVLRAYHWPGNVRELFHVLDYAQNVTDSQVMEVRHLPPYLLKHRSEPAAPLPAIDFSRETLQGLMDGYERQVIAQALDHCGYNISRTAQTLGILRQSLQYRIRKYGLIF